MAGPIDAEGGIEVRRGFAQGAGQWAAQENIIVDDQDKRGRRGSRPPSQETIDFALATGTPVFVSLPVVEELTSLTKPTITKWRKAGLFPEPVTLRDAQTEKDRPPVAWVLTEVQAYQRSRLDARG